MNPGIPENGLDIGFQGGKNLKLLCYYLFAKKRKEFIFGC
jgi:hypothetical protein